ncbi:MAG TPA: hypothetical protein VFJ71_12230 [Candidatus Limnocylindrales bacterium]|nr:hypothetical protein [Candidatus Limnocylindrales bacterium]
MPHVSEFRATGDHDRHDLLLVAALAAGDLSGTDRDHALDLTRSCATCADLHDDLVSIARATASVPPPITTCPRDFRLTPADAARLRPRGWRRLFGSLTGAGSLASRPLGIGLATMGLVGLLIGNAPILSLGGGASSPAGVGGSAARPAAEAAGGAQPAASAGGPAYVTVPATSAAASMAAASGDVYGTAEGGASPSAASIPRDTALEPVPAPASPEGVRGALDGMTQSAATTPRPDTITAEPGTPPADSSPFRPLNLVFGLAVILGLGILVAARFRSRSTV